MSVKLQKDCGMTAKTFAKMVWPGSLIFMLILDSRSESFQSGGAPFVPRGTRGISIIYHWYLFVFL